MDGRQLEHVLEVNYSKIVLDKSCRYGVECCRELASGTKVAGEIRSLLNTSRVYNLKVQSYYMKACFSVWKVKRWKGGRRKHLGIWIYSWTASRVRYKENR